MMVSLEKKVKVVLPRGGDLDLLSKNNSLEPFSPKLMSFVDAFSNKILSEQALRKIPELVALGFWFRRSRINQLKNSYLAGVTGETIKQPRGLVFHIAPSNVDTIFIYSWVLSLLVGNSNVVRISTKSTAVVDGILNVLGELFEDQDHGLIRERNFFVRYEHDESITSYFSNKCDVRAIWGGDDTISVIRQTPIPAHATELTFSNKFSFAVIDANSFLREEKQGALIEGFYNDAMWFEQMACSSPRLVLWIGDKHHCAKAQDQFWGLFEKYVQKSGFGLSDADFMNKFLTENLLAAKASGNLIHPASNNLVSRIALGSLDELYEDIHCGAGLFYEFYANDLSCLNGIISRRIQTISSFGISSETYRNWISINNLPGVDRIVPIGKALEFSSIWDGYNMLDHFSREISVSV